MVFGSIFGGNKFNVDGDKVHRGSKRYFVHQLGVMGSDVYYCGQFKMECRCGGCDGRCGPDTGCPCSACYAFFQQNRAGGMYGTNSDNDVMFPGDPGGPGLGDLSSDDTLYCGKVDPFRTCFCRGCDNRCGPDNGCPCKSCTIAQLQQKSSLENSRGRSMWRGFGFGTAGITGLPAGHVFYCGAHYSYCECGECDGTCGPSNGCPCPSCLEMVGDEGGNNILIHLAIQNCWSEMENLIEENDVGDINARAGVCKWTALSYTCWRGHFNLVKLLLEHDDIDINKANKDGMTPLHEAAKWGHFDIVELLVEAGANILSKENTGKTPIDVALSHDEPMIAEYLSFHLESPPQKSRELPHAQDTNESCEAILGNAIENGDKSKVQYLIDSTTVNLNCTLKDGNTPLCRATIINNSPIAEELISNGASVEKPSRCGETPLYLASKLGHIDMVRLMLKHNARFDAVNAMENDWTALHVAAYENKEDVVLELLRAGAKPNLRSSASRLPQDYAKSENLKFILIQHTKKYEFDGMVQKLIASGSATVEQLDNLTGKFTSVYDLRPLCSIANTIITCSSAITKKSFKPVLMKAIDHIISDKMVLDDHALLFFINMIKFAREKGFITENEFELWRHRAVKINIQNIEYLLEIMRRVQENSWRLSVVEQRLDQMDSTISKVVKAYQQVNCHIKDLYNQVCNIQDVMKQEREREEAMQKQRRVLGFVSMALCLVGGPLVKEIGEMVIDLANPLELLNFAVDANSVDAFLETNWEKVELKPIVTKVLEKVMLDKQEFVQILQTSIRYESGIDLDSIDTSKSRDIKVNNQPQEKGSIPAVTQTVKKTRFADVVKQLVKMRTEDIDAARKIANATAPINATAQANAVASTNTTTQANITTNTNANGVSMKNGLVSYVWLDDVSNYLYHSSIEVSKGELNEYLEMTELVDDDINDSIRVLVDGHKETNWTPLDFAVYMGYSDIVSYLVKQPSITLQGKPASYVIQAKKKQKLLAQAA